MYARDLDLVEVAAAADPPVCRSWTTASGATRKNVLFRGREREHPDRGRALLERMAEDVKELGHAEGSAVFEGRSMTMVLAPKVQQP